MSLIAKLFMLLPKNEVDTPMVCNHDLCISRKEFEDFKSKIGMKLARLDERKKRVIPKKEQTV